MVLFAAGSVRCARTLLVVASVVLAGMSALGQSNATPNATPGAPVSQPASTAASLPQFEVATIKPIDPNAVHSVGVEVSPGGTVALNGLTLKGMICTAFNLSYWQIEGGDPWMEKTQYDVVGKPPESVEASQPNPRHTLFGIEDERLRQMLQALLIDRVQLQFHRETKTGKVYLLERNGKALQLRPTNAATAGPAGGIGFASLWDLSNTTMPQLADFASTFYLHRPVFDRTGLSGAFNYRSPPEDYAAYESDPTGSFVEMIQAVGLKLVTAEGPVETFVIDRAEPPSPN
jgi:uncharacterized protein (TIGR03435 family)